MMEKGNKYLSDILRAIDLIKEFIEPISGFSSYSEDLKTQSAVERQLGIIGEAVNNFDKLFPEDTLQNARRIVGFRNRIIHAYDSVDNSMIWAIIVKHLPGLREEAQKRLENISQ